MTALNQPLQRGLLNDHRTRENPVCGEDLLIRDWLDVFICKREFELPIREKRGHR